MPCPCLGSFRRVGAAAVPAHTQPEGEEDERRTLVEGHHTLDDNLEVGHHRGLHMAPRSFEMSRQLEGHQDTPEEEDLQRKGRVINICMSSSIYFLKHHHGGCTLIIKGSAEPFGDR